MDIDRVFWCNEAVLKLNGCINRHNCVYWAPDNPKVTIDVHVNLTGVCVWCAISSEGILGLFFRQNSDCTELSRYATALAFAIITAAG